jgi:hypothetical protein
LATINRLYPIQKESNIFRDGSWYSHLLRKHWQITPCVASRRHGPLYLAIRVNVSRFHGRVLTHDWLFATLRIAAFGGVATTAVKRSGN